MESNGDLVVLGGYGSCVVLGVSVVEKRDVTGLGSWSPWDHFWHASKSLTFMASRILVTPSPGVCGCAVVVVDVPAGVAMMEVLVGWLAWLWV